MSLLELVIATSMLAMVLTAVMVVLRTGRQAWEAHEADFTRIESAHATLRHLVREVRQADAVTAISAAADASGSLALAMPDGSVKAWDHDAGSDCVNHGLTTATELLAPNITALRFVGYEADGVTATTVPGDIQAVEIEVTVQLPVETNGTRVVHSWAWLRTW
jgi:hypothetical protein